MKDRRWRRRGKYLLSPPIPPPPCPPHPPRPHDQPLSEEEEEEEEDTMSMSPWRPPAVVDLLLLPRLLYLLRLCSPTKGKVERRRDSIVEYWKGIVRRKRKKSKMNRHLYKTPCKTAYILGLGQELGSLRDRSGSANPTDLDGFWTGQSDPNARVCLPCSRILQISMAFSLYSVVRSN